MIEIFKTNVTKKQASEKMLKQIKELIPGSEAGFDLDDCDRILRVKSEAVPFEPGKVVALLEASGYSCELLKD